MNPEVTLRNMNPSEYREISRLSFDSFVNDAAERSGQTIESVRKRVGDPPLARSASDLWYIAEAEGRSIGHLWIQLLPEPGEAFGFDIFLDESARGQGMGRQMMLAGQALLRGLNIRKLKICVFDDNVPARKLYESLGFRETGFKPKKRQYEMEIEV